MPIHPNIVASSMYKEGDIDRKCRIEWMGIDSFGIDVLLKRGKGGFHGNCADRITALHFECFISYSTMRPLPRSSLLRVY